MPTSGRARSSGSSDERVPLGPASSSRAGSSSSALRLSPLAASSSLAAFPLLVVLAVHLCSPRSSTSQHTSSSPLSVPLVGVHPPLSPSLPHPAASRTSQRYLFLSSRDPLSSMRSRPSSETSPAAVPLLVPFDLGLCPLRARTAIESIATPRDESDESDRSTTSSSGAGTARHRTCAERGGSAGTTQRCKATRPR